MNILLIGNGFDLAHGLPTQYKDFLEWVDIIVNYGKTVVDSEKFNKYIADLYSSEDDSRRRELEELLSNNIWVRYFEYKKRLLRQKSNWIDFESEISKVIKSLDKDMLEIYVDGYNEDDLVEYLSNDFLDNEFTYRHADEIADSGDNLNYVTFAEIRDKLYNDLNKIIRALEIYLSDYIAKIEPHYYIKDIYDLKVDKVLSFNYTTTYADLYDQSGRIEYNYIHGDATLGNTIETNNMVLGINEYLDDTRKNLDIEFVGFKKFYQRIYKTTDSNYKFWINEIKRDFLHENSSLKYERYGCVPFSDVINRHYLYIYGHSLDSTDKDILEELILNDNVYTTIFYLEKVDASGKSDNGRADLGKKITNLVKVIGQDELIKRTSGITKTIEFRKISTESYKIEKRYEHSNHWSQGLRR